jgi:hypothetical protein
MIAGLFADQIEAMVSRHHRVVFSLLTILQLIARGAALLLNRSNT